MAGNFSEVPVLDYSLITAGKKNEFILQLRHAVVNVGFLYLSNPPVEKRLIDSLIDYIPKLFELPQERKDAVAMRNSQHFMGYTRLGSELTKGNVDQREQFDFATEYHNKWKPGDPEYLRLWGDSQWPDEKLIPGFRETVTHYLAQVEALSYEFTSLLAESLGLPPDGLSKFYDDKEHMCHPAKIVKYPSRDTVSSDQGVGPHFDAGFLTFLLQASPHPGLQVQNLSGRWIDAPPIPGTFVINIGKGLEAVTQGLARATSHRVLSPPVGSTARYSVPFFQNISQYIRLAEHTIHFPPEILKLKDERGEVGEPESVNFSEYDREPSGQVNLIGRVKSHPDVALRHYPALFKQFFPNGLPKQGLAY